LRISITHHDYDYEFRLRLAIRYNNAVKSQRKTGCGCFLLLLLSIALLGAAWFYTTWRSSEAVLPPGLVINDLPMGNMTRAQALRAIEEAYTAPITVTYAGQLLPPLLPEMIELRVDMDATAANLDAAVAAEASPFTFIRYLRDRFLGREHEITKVNAVVIYSRPRVNTYLERTAQQYDHEPRHSVPLPESGTFRPALEGTTLNTAASLPRLIDAILAAQSNRRRVDLVVEIEPAPEASIDILADALEQAIAVLDGNAVAGIFAKDLSTGQEFCLNCKAAFTGESAAKVGIALAAYRERPEELSVDDAARLVQSLAPGEGAGIAADILLAQLGDGSAISGAQAVTGLFLDLGLDSSYLTIPLTPGSEDALPITTPANTRTDLNTAPHPGMQTTPMEAGLLLESVYYCAQNGGALRILYPRAMTPLKCQSLLATMSRNRAHSLLAQDLPLGVSAAHQQGLGTTTHSEVALFYGRRSDFLLTTFLYNPAWATPEEAAPYFARIGHLTYRFFNGD
jgi:beta-lactamase class A